MSIVEIARDGAAAQLPTSCESRTARFGIHWPTEHTVVVSADGEVDAANADQLGDYASRAAAQCQHLVLDLSGVEFFGSQGFSMLHMFNVRCAEAGVRWAMVPSVAVDRVLRICDPQGGLRAAGTVDDALDMVHGEPRRLLQLVAP